MPSFTIETTYRLPVFRQKSYEADSLEAACRLALSDDDWSGDKQDYESAGETYVSGAWSGAAAAHVGSALAVPSEHGEKPQRIAPHFEVLLGLIKLLGDPDFWLRRAKSAIAKAEAISAGAPDPALPVT